jgi:lysozyme family protein
MANINKLVPILLKHEGGYVNDKVDKGGATNLGITEHTWRKLGHDKNNDGVIDEEDIKLLDQDDFRMILKIGYWDEWQADKIKNQSIANFLVDWTYNSGVWGIKIPQKLLGLKEDGVVGKLTLEAVNNYDQEALHSKLILARISFLQTIIKNDIERVEKKLGKKLTEKEQLKLTNKKFERGWLNRVLSFKFVP